ncbi:MAG: ATP-dependent DNA helicase RecG, partial [Selenomonas sp.]
MELQTSLLKVKGIGAKKYEALNKLGLFTVYDLLTYYPRTYEDRRVLTPLAEVVVGEQQAVTGVIRHIVERRTGRGIHILSVDIDDGTGFLQVTFFQQKFLKGRLKAGLRLFAIGKIEYAFGGHGKKQMRQIKDFSLLEKDGAANLGILPVYAASGSLNQKFFRTLFTTVCKEIQT